MITALDCDRLRSLTVLCYNQISFWIVHVYWCYLQTIFGALQELTVCTIMAVLIQMVKGFDYIYCIEMNCSSRPLSSYRLCGTLYAGEKCYAFSATLQMIYHTLQWVLLYLSCKLSQGSTIDVLEKTHSLTPSCGHMMYIHPHTLMFFHLSLSFFSTLCFLSPSLDLLHLPPTLSLLQYWLLSPTLSR